MNLCYEQRSSPSTVVADYAPFYSPYYSSLTTKFNCTTPYPSYRRYNHGYPNQNLQEQLYERKKKPLPPYASAVTSVASGNKLTPEEKSQFVALDCEMVGVGDRGESVAARATIIDWYGNVLLDEYIKPHREVTDYRTYISGITAEQLLEKNGAIDLFSCRNKILEVLHHESNGKLLYKNKILIGHGLKQDMTVLGIRYPWFKIRDTAKYEPFTKLRRADGVRWPRKLKDLAKEKLDRDIQIAGQPHCPIEDAKAAMDLYKSDRRRWEKCIDHKINKTRNIQRQQWNSTQLRQLDCHYFPHGESYYYDAPNRTYYPRWCSQLQPQLG